jgi:hypothetical protein
MKRKKQKNFTEMTAGELEAATAEFDKEFVVDMFEEPDAEAVATMERARKKPGRPRKGKGAKVISVSVEKSLLDRCDELAKERGVSRASLISRGLRAILAAERVK